MTQSSPLQSLPAPLRSILRDPTAIAVLASIGMHGLLWAVLPYLPLSAAQPTEADIQREVGLVELSPEELARVPQFDTQTTIPIPGVPLPPADAGRLPQQFTPFPVPPAGSLFPPSSLYVPPSLGRSPLILRSNQPLARSNTPTTRQPQRPSPTPTPTPTSTPTANATPTPTPTPLPPPTPGETTSAAGTPIDGVPPLEGTPTPNNGATALNPTPSPSGTAQTPPAGTSNSTAPRDRPAPPPRGGSDRPTPTDRPSINYAYSAEGTSVEAGQSARLQWLSRLNRSSSTAPRIVPLTQTLPLAALEQLPESIRDEVRNGDRPVLASFGVVVSANNRLVGEPELLLRSGFPVLDQQIKEQIANSDFRNETGSEQIYQVVITLQPEGTATAP